MVSTWVLLRDPELLFYVREYANNMESLKEAFVKVWVYMMNADRFDGPTGNVCDNISIDRRQPVADSNSEAAAPK